MAAAEPSRVLGLDPGWVLVNQAEYTASQAPNEEVTIRATGTHPSAGYETKFVVSPLRIYPPQWMLAVKRPEGSLAQVMTPFDVTTSFKASNQIATIRVTDASGGAQRTRRAGRLMRISRHENPGRCCAGHCCALPRRAGLRECLA